MKYYQCSVQIRMFWLQCCQCHLVSSHQPYLYSNSCAFMFLVSCFLDNLMCGYCISTCLVYLVVASLLDCYCSLNSVKPLLLNCDEEFHVSYTVKSLLVRDSWFVKLLMSEKFIPQSYISKFAGSTIVQRL